MYQLKLVPETESGRNELTGEVYWYPLKVYEKILMSVNITTQSTYKRLGERWRRGGRIIISSPIDDTYAYFLYFGTVGDPKIIPMFGERPLLVRNRSIYYFFSDDDFDGIYQKINSMENKPHVDTTSVRAKQKLCLDFFESYLLPDWSPSLKHTKSKPIDKDVRKYGFHTDKIGLHPLLHLIQLIPDNEWNKKYHKQMLIFLFKNNFLVSWINDIENIDKKEDILQKCEEFSNGEITTVAEFKNVLKEIIKQLDDTHEFFGMLYLAAQCATESSVFGALFNNLFEFLPKEQKEWIGYPRFQPKLIVDELELHFIQNVRSSGKIENMVNGLNQIFDDVDFYELRDDRYRFICKVGVLMDYSSISNWINVICTAVRTIARKNKLKEPTREMWVKRIGVQFVTPPQFEDDVLLAFSKNWFFRRKPRSLDELDEENKRKILKADIICDYRTYELKRSDEENKRKTSKKDNQDIEFIFPFKYSRDVQNSYVVLNNLLFKNHNFTRFGETKPLTE